ncbi:MAG: putative DNA-binding domain, partial [Gammaproteobacteria bacterium]|nr:putative DNA-binding domain [Gammaproteobacteria bacterium]
MTSLRKLQHDMQSFLLTTQPSIYPHIVGPDADFITERLAVYSEAYLLRLQEILASAFPGVRAIA